MRDVLRILADHFPHDAVTPCRADGADPDDWWPEHHVAPDAARDLCRDDDGAPCHLAAQCFALGRAVGATGGIWGGVQRGRWR